MSYEYDAFISYRRLGQWPQWLREQFYKPFKHYVETDLGRASKIYWDEMLEDVAGVDFPQELGLVLARSKVLVPLWSRGYFNSPWCATELSMMRARERTCRFRTGERRDVLIVPALLHDGEHIPTEFQTFSPVVMKGLTRLRVASDSPDKDALDRAIERLAHSVANAVEAAPAVCDPTWADIAIDEFFAVFKLARAEQTTLPNRVPGDAA